MKSNLRCRLLPIVLLFALIIILPSQAFSLSLTVNWTGDGEDINPGDGLCDFNPSPFFTQCSLRAAIQEANAIQNTHDLIQLPPGIYHLTLTGSDNVGATGDLDITDDITIESTYPGQLYADTTIVDGGSIDRVFDLHGTVSKDVVVRFYNFTIQNGQAVSGSGGGGGILATYADLYLDGMIIQSNDVLGTDNSDAGGGLNIMYATTPTYIRRTIFTENAANGGGAICINGGSIMEMSDTTLNNNFATTSGGGILSYGSTAISNSTVSGNGAASNGGGVYSRDKLSLANVTISGNRATGGGYYGSSGTAAGLYIGYAPATDLDTPLVRNCTIAGNTGTTSVFFGTNNRVKFSNTLVSSVGTGCGFFPGAAYASENNNLNSDNSCNFVAGSDIVNTDPQLGTLSDNGGTTLTHLPQPGSPLINAGFNFQIPELLSDQRGMSRPQGSNYDIGAVEVKQCSYFPIKNRLGTLSYICL